jgi:uncharacterized protein YcnI
MSYRHALAIVAIGALAVVLTAPMAGAHITIDPGEAPQGGFATLTFRVPNEHDDASTTRFEVNLPTHTPIPSVSVQPKPGWSYDVGQTPLDEPIETENGDKVTDVVSKITWRGGAIAPDEFEEFAVSLGPLPEDTLQLLFPSLQTLDSGEVVAWTEERVENGGEPEHPAPRLRLVEGGDDHDAVGSDGDMDEEEGAVTDDLVGLTAAAQDDVDRANTLGIIGIVIGAVAVLTAAFTLVLLRRRAN